MNWSRLLIVLPNILSLMRILLGALFFFSVIEKKIPNANICILLALLSDFLDGWIARRCNAQSSCGQWLDPLCDKIFIASVFISLVYMGPRWLLWAILGRDFLLVIGAGILWCCKTNTFPASMVGKINTVLECMLALTILNTFPVWYFYTLASMMVVTMIISTVEYGTQGYRILAARPDRCARHSIFSLAFGLCAGTFCSWFFMGLSLSPLY